MCRMPAPVHNQTIDHIIGIISRSKELLLRHGGEQRRIPGKVSPKRAWSATSPSRRWSFPDNQTDQRDAPSSSRKTRQRIAIVIDEYGGTEGLISLEDILEEIVGEYDDEFSHQARQVKAGRQPVRDRRASIRPPSRRTQRARSSAIPILEIHRGRMRSDSGEIILSDVTLAGLISRLPTFPGSARPGGWRPLDILSTSSIRQGMVILKWIITASQGAEKLRISHRSKSILIDDSGEIDSGRREVRWPNWRTSSRILQAPYQARP